jgi:phospholipase C
MYRFVISAFAVMALVSSSPRSLAQEAGARPVTLQPDPSPEVAPYYRDWTKGDEPHLSREEAIKLLRAAVKYIFVIFHENESFDHYFGTFPGANGIYSDGRSPRAAKDTPGFTQAYKDLVSGETVTVEPFLIGPAQNANVLDSVGHHQDRLALSREISPQWITSRSTNIAISRKKAGPRTRLREPNSPASS